VLADAVPPAERTRVTRAFEAARAREPDDPARALAEYQAILDRHSGFAEAHFRVARLQERLGRDAEANAHYIAARDCDAYPVRCPSPFQEAYRAVARRHPSTCILIDGPAVLRRICPRGILDDHAFHDAHHPTLAGHVALAQAIIDALHARGALGWRGGATPTIDPAEVAAHFGIDAEKWVIVCARSATHYRDFSWARFDRSERLAKQRRYEEAGRAIGRGVPPEETEIPGLGAGARPVESAMIRGSQ
jgi:hypothetical protein